MKFKKMLSIAFVALVFMFVSTMSASADVDWPKKTINIITAFSAGGDTDFNARTMAQFLAKELGCSVVVSNVTGAGGSIASNQVKNSAPDGYTILCNHAALNMSTACGIIDWSFKDLDMGFVFGFGQPESVFVRGDAPWNSIEDLIKDSIERPNQITIAGSTGATTSWAPIALNNAGAKLNIVDVGNASDRIPALLGGHVDVIINSLSTAEDYLKTGQFKCLAVCASERSPQYPDYPTLKELGIDCEYDMCYSFFFPKGTNPEIIEKLEQAVRKIVDTNEEYALKLQEAYKQTPKMLNTEESYEYYSEMLDRLMGISSLLRGEK